jgi:putative ABC transport system substrate-binding protein
MQFGQLKRRELISLLGGAVAAWPGAARAQQPKKVPRLCFITFDPATLRSNQFEAFFQGLRDLGCMTIGIVRVAFFAACAA